MGGIFLDFVKNDFENEGNDGRFFELVNVLLAIKSQRDMVHFLQAILTADECEQIPKRWQIVKSLLSGETQREVAKKLGISVSKVSRGAREIKMGTGIFQKVYKELDKNVVIDRRFSAGGFGGSGFGEV